MILLLLFETEGRSKALKSLKSRALIYPRLEYIPDREKLIRLGFHNLTVRTSKTHVSCSSDSCERTFCSWQFASSHHHAAPTKECRQFHLIEVSSPAVKKDPKYHFKELPGIAAKLGLFLVETHSQPRRSTLREFPGTPLMIKPPLSLFLSLTPHFDLNFKFLHSTS